MSEISDDRPLTFSVGCSIMIIVKGVESMVIVKAISVIMVVAICLVPVLIHSKENKENEKK